MKWSRSGRISHLTIAVQADCQLWMVKWKFQEKELQRLSTIRARAGSYQWAWLVKMSTSTSTRELYIHITHTCICEPLVVFRVCRETHLWDRALQFGEHWDTQASFDRRLRFALESRCSSWSCFLMTARWYCSMHSLLKILFKHNNVLTIILHRWGYSLISVPVPKNMHLYSYSCTVWNHNKSNKHLPLSLSVREIINSY